MKSPETEQASALSRLRQSIVTKALAAILVFSGCPQSYKCEQALQVNSKKTENPKNPDYVHFPFYRGSECIEIWKNQGYANKEGLLTKQGCERVNTIRKQAGLKAATNLNCAKMEQ